jgi:DNA-binding transcriptional regulator of glucitol operon
MSDSLEFKDFRKRIQVEEYQEASKRIKLREDQWLANYQVRLMSTLTEKLQKLAEELEEKSNKFVEQQKKDLTDRKRIYANLLKRSVQLDEKEKIINKTMEKDLAVERERQKLQEIEKERERAQKIVDERVKEYEELLEKKKQMERDGLIN